MKNDVQYLQEAPSFVNVVNVCLVTFIIQHTGTRCLSFMQNHELAHLQFTIYNSQNSSLTKNAYYLQQSTLFSKKRPVLYMFYVKYQPLFINLRYSSMLSVTTFSVSVTSVSCSVSNTVSSVCCLSSVVSSCTVSGTSVS